MRMLLWTGAVVKHSSVEIALPVGPVPLVSYGVVHMTVARVACHKEVGAEVR